MDTTLSVSKPSILQSPGASRCKQPTAFEVNEKAFGPVAATAIGAAARAADTVGSTVSLSAQGLQRLGREIGEAWDGATTFLSDAVDDVEDGAAQLGNDAVDAVRSAYRAVGSGFDSALDAVEGAFDDTAQAVSDTASAAGSGLSSAADAVAHYASLAASALKL